MSESDFRDRVPLVHHVPHKNLWQRWMAWSGSFLIVSILLHIILLGGATILVVQVVSARKQPLKFTAAPPSASASAIKVKPSKKTSAPAPAVSKRIISMDMNAKFVLPAMDMTSSTGPDMMATVMSGMGAQGLGAGSAGGAAGMASMPVAGLTAFGFKGSGIVGGLKGQIYDLKQTPDRKPTGLTDDGLHSADGKLSPSTALQLAFFDEFFRGWDEKLLEKYYRAKDSVTAYQVLVPRMDSAMGPKAFGVEKEIPKACHWMVLYKGMVSAPKDGTFRFVGKADDMIAVRFNNQNVFVHTLQYFDKLTMSSFNPPLNQKKEEIIDRGAYGKWFSVSAGTSYPIEIAIAEMPGGSFTAQLYIQDKNPVTPYPHRTFPGMEKYLALPVFQLKKGLPLPKREAVLTAPPKANPNWAPSENYPEVPPEPLIFLGK